MILFYSKTKEYYFDEENIKLPYTTHKRSKTGHYGGRMGIDENGKRYVEKWGTGKKKLYRYYILMKVRYQKMFGLIFNQFNLVLIKDSATQLKNQKL